MSICDGVNVVVQATGDEAATPAPPLNREEERALREARYEEAVRSHAVRTEPLGFDRFYRRYYWLEGKLLEQVIV